MADKELKIGDRCRARYTAPARYLGDGLCVYVSAQHSGRMIDEVGDGAPSPDLPHVSDEELKAFVTARYHFRREIVAFEKAMRRIQAVVAYNEEPLDGETIPLLSPTDLAAQVEAMGESFAKADGRLRRIDEMASAQKVPPGRENY